MAYIENPKTKGSGIICCIPQVGRCPNGCEDCFFQSGRSYLEPLGENLPNMPVWPNLRGRVVRVNDGNDSNVQRETVIQETATMDEKFYNTAIPKDIDKFPGPVVLTVNPGKMTDEGLHKVEPIPPNLMFVRVRTNTWNERLVNDAVNHYAAKGVPVVLTFMAYFDTADKIPSHCRYDYTLRTRTLNEYWAITHAAWCQVMATYRINPLVHSCGTEGVSGGSACRHCGNCLREYFATMERMRQAKEVLSDGD